jgi:hypothetical protein
MQLNEILIYILLMNILKSKKKKNVTQKTVFILNKVVMYHFKIFITAVQNELYQL